MSIFIKLPTYEEVEKHAKKMYRLYHVGMDRNKKEREARAYAKVYVPIYTEGRDLAAEYIAMNLVRLKKLTYEEIASACSLTVERVKSL